MILKNKIFQTKIIIFMLAVFLLMFFSYLNFSLNKKVNVDLNKVFFIKSGSSVSASIQSLKEKKIINSSLRFKILSYMYSINPTFISGKYSVQKSDTEYSILIKIVKGNLYQESITILEGATFKNILSELNKNRHINSTTLKNSDINFYTSSFLKTLHPEGLCFPDTYKFSSGISLKNFLSICSKKMDIILKKYWNNRDYSLPYKTPYEMLIMASIIEKETSLLSEKPIVASVFVNRLNKNMRLQADPTVIYGIKNYNGNITKKDLMTKNEYNTYKINGLPKSPICSPSESSIRAASRPKKTDFLYFVANDKGEHIFSRNYKDHVNAVNKYQKK
jgi:UPF0755 protein